ncbi:Xaa-Pro peptidase family protein [Roseibacterium sp. SDUM158016]|jgi:Xaa-Pro dipeptidase|uniref:M24 family metallopeptidase n=1 Tax=Roseicyclus sediminis TaxID=2980997 RepID=UPI0021D15B97|nr:Xaa-Pro peptidase family protein [Roseibacterium sp. SDUM158016]MCU4652645.1 Xaa-Pro peptidase family protein [Roseibacterium sp. SDUM158016]
MMNNADIALDIARQHNHPPFPPEEYARRLSALRTAMEAAGVPLVFFSSPEMICYITGFSCEYYQGQSPAHSPPASGVAVHVDHDRFIFFETPREAILATLECVPGADMRFYPNAAVRDGQSFILSELQAEGWLAGPVGLELRNYRPNPVVSAQFQAKIAAHGLEVVDITDRMAAVRRKKSPAELEAHRQAGILADIGLNAAREAISPGVTELEVFGAMIHAMALAGGEFPGILPPVASGIRSNCLHPLSSRKEIRKGERVWVDCSGVFKRYHTNTARTFWVGDPPDDVTEFHNKTIGAFEIIAEMLRPGMEIRPMLEAIDDYYKSVGVKQDIYWSGGYETGIAFPPDWVGSLLYDLHFTKPGDVFEPMTVINHECNFYGPRGTGQSSTIEAIIFDTEAAEFCSRIGREIQVIRC